MPQAVDYSYRAGQLHHLEETQNLILVEIPDDGGLHHGCGQWQRHSGCHYKCLLASLLLTAGLLSEPVVLLFVQMCRCAGRASAQMVEVELTTAARAFLTPWST